MMAEFRGKATGRAATVAVFASSKGAGYTPTRASTALALFDIGDRPERPALRASEGCRRGRVDRAVVNPR